MLSLAGGALGLVLGIVGIRALLAVNPAGHPAHRGGRIAASAMDWRVLAFTLAVALVTGVVFGLVPALQASRVDLTTTLKESGARSGAANRRTRRGRCWWSPRWRSRWSC